MKGIPNREGGFFEFKNNFEIENFVFLTTLIFTGFTFTFLQDC